MTFLLERFSSEQGRRMAPRRPCARGRQRRRWLERSPDSDPAGCRSRRGFSPAKRRRESVKIDPDRRLSTLPAAAQKKRRQ